MPSIEHSSCKEDVRTSDFAVRSKEKTLICSASSYLFSLTRTKEVCQAVPVKMGDFSSFSASAKLRELIMKRNVREKILAICLLIS